MDTCLICRGFPYVILFIAVLGTVNVANLTDGVDDLRALAIVIALFLQ